MTRHARNSTAGSVYTYHEKQKDAKASGFGSLRARLGKDSIKEFDCCSLTLQPCKNPVISPEGHLFDKEALLEYIIAKKNENSRKLKEFQKQKQREVAEQAELAAAEHRSKVEKFLVNEKGVGSHETRKGNESSVSNMAAGKSKQLPSFWVPSQTPDSKPVYLKKPEQTVYCPMSGKPLKLKDVIPVHFTLVPDDDKPGTSSGAKSKSLISKTVRYMCPITRDILSNSVPCAVLKPSGHVVTMDCVEKIIKKDMINPLTSEKLTDRDIVVLQRGGTGFSSTNKQLEAVEARPVMQS